MINYVARKPKTEKMISMPRKEAPFFSRPDWLVFFLTFLGVAGFYAFTQAPTVTLEDSGELVVAADYLGVPHPPGYPVWTMIAWLFTRLFSFMTYYGQPNPAWGVNFCSGFFGALTCAAAAILVSRIGRMLIASDDAGTAAQATSNSSAWIAGIAGVTIGYALAFNSLFWSQSVIAEVYTINAFLHLLVLLLACMWIYRPQDNRILYWLAFILGLSITNCQPIVFLGPALLIIFFFADRVLFRDLTALGLFLIGGYLLYRFADTPAGVMSPALRVTQISAAVLLLLTPAVMWTFTRALFTEWRRILIMGLCFGLGLSFFIYMPIASDFNPPMNWGYPRTWQGFVHAVTRGQYQALDPAINLQSFFTQFSMYFRELELQFTFVLAIFGAVWVFAFRGLRVKERIWLMALTIAFLVLGVGMMVFLNPAHDIQSLFIARVQLVQAAAVYAILIGYGLVVALNVVARRSNAMLVFLLLAVLLAPTALLHKNYSDPELARTYGGAELRGHDFGWQFGNYQLRGAPAIMEEIKEGEEPLPNPAYPLPMEPGAIFYGGTDPGRFVPTYMIYSAQVRPDVFLITQNALADNTYMNVMRDLYGNQIWMPTPQDVNNSFQVYVQEVQAGNIPPSAAIKVDPNGRVSVQGVQGVMEINGIITKMMFERNKWRHTFYVEESYVMAWMYPYMEPHGLILKINNEPLTGLTSEIVKNDMEFWDWYARRLLSNPKFLRDSTARKSFSKLRCAIGGLYAWRGMFSEAETAYKQAVELCPISPEANFRLADFYQSLGRREDAVKLLEANAAADPRNDKIVGFIGQIKEIQNLYARAEYLEEALAQETLSIDNMFELCGIYMRLGKEQSFLQLGMRMLQTTNMPPELYRQLAVIAAPNATQPRLLFMRDSFVKYLQFNEKDVSAWIDLGAINLALHNQEQALIALRQAVKFGGEPVKRMLAQDQRFTVLRNNPNFHKLITQSQQLDLQQIPQLRF